MSCGRDAACAACQQPVDGVQQVGQEQHARQGHGGIAGHDGDAVELDVDEAVGVGARRAGDVAGKGSPDQDIQEVGERHQQPGQRGGGAQSSLRAEQQPVAEGHQRHDVVLDHVQHRVEVAAVAHPEGLGTQHEVVDQEGDRDAEGDGRLQPGTPCGDAFAPGHPPDVQHQGGQEVEEADGVAEDRIVIEVAPPAGGHVIRESVAAGDDQHGFPEEEKPVLPDMHRLSCKNESAGAARFAVRLPNGKISIKIR